MVPPSHEGTLSSQSGRLNHWTPSFKQKLENQNFQRNNDAALIDLLRGWIAPVFEEPLLNEILVWHWDYLKQAGFAGDPNPIPNQPKVPPTLEELGVCRDMLAESQHLFSLYTQTSRVYLAPCLALESPAAGPPRGRWCHRLTFSLMPLDCWVRVLGVCIKLYSVLPADLKLFANRATVPIARNQSFLEIVKEADTTISFHHDLPAELAEELILRPLSEVFRREDPSCALDGGSPFLLSARPIVSSGPPILLPRPALPSPSSSPPPLQPAATSQEAGSVVRLWKGNSYVGVGLLLQISSHPIWLAVSPRYLGDRLTVEVGSETFKTDVVAAAQSWGLELQLLQLRVDPGHVLAGGLAMDYLQVPAIEAKATMASRELTNSCRDSKGIYVAYDTVVNEAGFVAYLATCPLLLNLGPCGAGRSIGLSFAKILEILQENYVCVWPCTARIATWIDDQKEGELPHHESYELILKQPLKELCRTLQISCPEDAEHLTVKDYVWENPTSTLPFTDHIQSVLSSRRPAGICTLPPAFQPRLFSRILCIPQPQPARTLEPFVELLHAIGRRMQFEVFQCRTDHRQLVASVTGSMSDVVVLLTDPACELQRAAGETIVVTSSRQDNNHFDKLEIRCKAVIQFRLDLTDKPLELFKSLYYFRELVHQTEPSLSRLVELTEKHDLVDILDQLHKEDKVAWAWELADWLREGDKSQTSLNKRVERARFAAHADLFLLVDFSGSPQPPKEATNWDEVWQLVQRRPSVSPQAWRSV